ncbi:MAG: hypothetical protein U1E77_00465 [Inhella sp.]
MNTLEEFDYVISGAGSAGCALAAACPKTPAPASACWKRAAPTAC